MLPYTQPMLTFQLTKGFCLGASAHGSLLKVGLEPTDPGVSSSLGKSLSSEKMLEMELHSSSLNGCPVPLAAKCNKVLPVQFGDFEPTKSPFAGGSTTGSTQHWHLDDFLGLTEPNQNYGYMDNSSSKVIVPSNVCSFYIMCFCNFFFLPWVSIRKLILEQSV